MTFYAVTYTYIDDEARINEVRPTHREFLRGLHEAGALRASGPLPNTSPPQALLIMTGESENAVRDALAADPFNEANIITSVGVQEWNPAIGVFAAGGSHA